MRAAATCDERTPQRGGIPGCDASYRAATRPARSRRFAHVELASSNPARAYALAGRKGAIAVGADADLAIVDLESSRTVTDELLLSAQEYTPFEGMELVGWPAVRMLRGSVVFRDGEATGEPSGSYLREPVAVTSS